MEKLSENAFILYLQVIKTIDVTAVTCTDLADRPMILIRFNPDKFEDKSCFDRAAKLIKNEWNRRIKVLKKEIKR